MTIVTVADLHAAPDPARRLAQAAALAHTPAGTDAHRLIVRCPDRATNTLHALTAQDIAEMLHVHGRVREIAVTDGGTIVAAADLRRRRGQVAIWTGQAIGPWSPTDITQRGLGGSETAAVRLAEQLAEIGYAVTLYGHFEQPHGMISDIMLRHFSAFDPTRPLDALIGFRDARLFDRRPNAKFACLWLEDLAPAEGLTALRASNLDRVFTVSHWHKRQLLDSHPWLDPKLASASRNGIVHSFFDGTAPERQQRVVYSSSPDRGGDIVLECWPQIRERVPEAELVLSYPRWFDICAQHFQAAHGHLVRLRELLDQPGVSRIEGGLGQKRLAHLMRSSTVWVAPSYYTPGAAKFEETACISCTEAQAAGLVVVASNWGALTENVLHGTLLDGDPSEPDGQWRRDFVDAVVRGLTDPDVQHAARTIGPEMVKDQDWRGPAEQLAAHFPGVRAPAHHPV